MTISTNGTRKHDPVSPQEIATEILSVNPHISGELALEFAKQMVTAAQEGDREGLQILMKEAWHFGEPGYPQMEVG